MSAHSNKWPEDLKLEIDISQKGNTSVSTQVVSEYSRKKKKKKKGRRRKRRMRRKKRKRKKKKRNRISSKWAEGEEKQQKG